MYQSTEAFGNLIQQDSRTFKSLITFGDVSITDAKSIKITGGSEGEDDFSLGSVISQYITVIISNCAGEIENHELTLQIGMDVNGLTEYIPMGYFTAMKPERSEDQITFTAYDRMIKLEKTFPPGASINNTIAALKKIQETTGVEVITCRPGNCSDVEPKRILMQGSIVIYCPDVWWICNMQQAGTN